MAAQWMKARRSCDQLALVQKEATEVFFSVTKLFQAKDANLRRMVYLVIKEVMAAAFTSPSAQTSTSLIRHDY